MWAYEYMSYKEADRAKVGRDIQQSQNKAVYHKGDKLLLQEKLISTTEVCHKQGPVGKSLILNITSQIADRWKGGYQCRWIQLW